MAFASDGRYIGRVSENISWDGDIFGRHTSPKYAIGTRVVYGERVYRYAHFGADTNRGVLVSQDISESSVVDTDNAIIAPASAATTTDGTLGSRFVQLTLASASANQYAGGIFSTTDDTGEGYSYTIKSNTATGDPATGDIRVELYEKLQVAVDATTDFAITGSMYANLELATAATDVAVCGVTASTMDVSDKEYGWVQTWGVATILQDGTIAVGDQISLSDGTDGAVQAAAGGGTLIADLIAEQLVGYCIHAGDTGGHGVFFLQVAP